MLKLTWLTLNLNILAPRQNLKNLLHTKFLARSYSIQYTDYFVSRIKTLGGDVSDRQTSIIGADALYKNTKL